MFYCTFVPVYEHSNLVNKHTPERHLLMNSKTE